MDVPIPAHAERIERDGVTAWICKTEQGWSLLRFPFRVDLEQNELRHSIDWVRLGSSIEGGQLVTGSGSMDRETFLEIAFMAVNSLEP